MRYLVLKPKSPTFDPRDVLIRDVAHLHSLLEPLADCSTELEAVSVVRRTFPDALGMPMPVGVGSGKIVMLGFLAEASGLIDPDDELPFVLFVQPISQKDSERIRIGEAAVGRGSVFDRKIWRVPPTKPLLAQTHAIEWRTNELEVPAFLDAQVGYDHRGRLTVYAEMGPHSMSITFEPNVVIRREEPRASSPTPDAHTSP